MNKKLVYPDYKNCIANLPNSILKVFGAEPVGDTLPLLDAYLERPYRNVVLLLLDGLGKAIAERHLAEDGPLRSHLAGIYSSTFLSTTVAATTSVLSGLQPCEHSWLGWDCYYPQIDKNVTVFLNVESGTDEPAADFPVAQTFTPFASVPERITRAGANGHALAPFWDPNPQSFDELCSLIKARCSEEGRNYVYAYWPQPDGLLHRHGCGSAIVHEDLLDVESAVSRLAEELRDTLLVVTADHGHIDTESVWIEDYPELWNCLVRRPSLEPRVCNFFVREGMEEVFAREFNSRFGDRFMLMPMERALEMRLFGTGRPHECFRSMLGNYIAIATGDLSIFPYREQFFLSMHGSLTEDEMLIPLFVFEPKRA